MAIRIPAGFEEPYQAKEYQLFYIDTLPGIRLRSFRLTPFCFDDASDDSLPVLGSSFRPILTLIHSTLTRYAGTSIPLYRLNVSLFPIAFEVVLNNQQTADYRPTNGEVLAKCW